MKNNLKLVKNDPSHHGDIGLSKMDEMQLRAFHCFLLKLEKRLRSNLEHDQIRAHLSVVENTARERGVVLDHEYSDEMKMACGVVICSDESLREKLKRQSHFKNFWNKESKRRINCFSLIENEMKRRGLI